MRARYKYEFMNLPFKNRRGYHNFLVKKEKYRKNINKSVDYYKSKHDITSIIETLQSKRFRDYYWYTRQKHPSWFILDGEETWRMWESRQKNNERKRREK